MITDTTAIMTFKGNGNVGIGDEDPDFLLEVNGTAGKPGGGSWSNSSDRRLKLPSLGSFLSKAPVIVKLSSCAFSVDRSDKVTARSSCSDFAAGCR